jgi:hypothetical protein
MNKIDGMGHGYRIRFFLTWIQMIRSGFITVIH